MALGISALGIPWYELEDWPAIKALMSDADKLHRTHAEWRIAAEQLERKLQRDGALVVRAVIRPAEFAAWCAERGLDINANARNLFASHVAVEKYRAQQGGGGGVH